MARPSDPNKQKLRVEAARLEREEGLKAPQIAARMDHEVQTVRSWLRAERGPKKVLFKPRVLALLEQGETDLAEISKKVGCGVENVQKIERDWRGFLKKTRRSGEEMLAEYLADPESHAASRFTRHKSFGRALVDECNRATGENPKQAKWILDLADGQFSRLRKRFRNADTDTAKRIACNHVQIRAIEAARGRALAKSSADRQEALSVLRSAHDLKIDCLACDADLARRESIILGDMMLYPDALACLELAEATYREIPGTGHCRFRNGLGSCAVARVYLLYYSGYAKSAVRSAETVIGTLVTPGETALYFRLRFGRALALLEVPGRASEARSTVSALMREVDENPTVPRLHLVFMAGRAAEKEGDIDAALDHYEDAYEYAQELQIGAAISALESDIARISGDPGEFRERIERLKFGHDGSDDEFPPWLASISQVLNHAANLAKTDFTGALSLLRHEGGGNGYFPLKVPAVPA